MSENLINAPIPLIQAINRKIDDVKTAPDKLYRTIDTANLPISLVFPEAGTTLWQRSQARTMEINYSVEVYVNPVTQGVFEEQVAFTSLLLSRFLRAYHDLFTCADECWVLDFGEDSGLRIEVDRSQPLRHQGPLFKMEWFPDVEYMGFIIKLPILISWGQEYFSED